MTVDPYNSVGRNLNRKLVPNKILNRLAVVVTTSNSLPSPSQPCTHHNRARLSAIVALRAACATRRDVVAALLPPINQMR